MKTVSIQRLNEVLKYDPETGIFLWDRPEIPKHHGKQAGSVNPKGYLVIRVDRVGVRAHRAAWAMMHGSYPEGELDHVNRNRLDNRIANLRMVTSLQNSHNRSGRRNSASGIKGVTWFKGDNLWAARITMQGKCTFLGLFKNKEDAAEAYRKASEKMHGEFAFKED